MKYDKFLKGIIRDKTHEGSPEYRSLKMKIRGWGYLAKIIFKKRTLG
ncbi:MAG: hypothetical protein Q4Q22_02555 [Methanosphaera sp.]|nr:hypothetical protein [Methanosphaera sp.]